MQQFHSTIPDARFEDKKFILLVNSMNNYVFHVLLIWQYPNSTYLWSNFAFGSAAKLSRLYSVNFIFLVSQMKISENSSLLNYGFEIHLFKNSHVFKKVARSKKSHVFPKIARSNTSNVQTNRTFF